MHDLNKAQIMELFQFDGAARVISEAYVASSSGHVQTGDVVHLSFPESNGDCHVKSGHILHTDTYVIKIASGFYDNPSKGLPSSNGMMLAFSATSGEPVAILRDEGWLTDMRTGLGGAIATKALANEDAEKVLIIGSGIQARFQAKCLASLMPSRSFNFNIWGRNEDAVKVLVEELRGQSLNADVAKNLDEQVSLADIIITTTPATSALFGDNLVKPGTHITAIGADTHGKQELPTSLIESASLLVCDMMSQSLNHGEFQVINDTNLSQKVLELGNILSNSCAGRTSDNDITIADLTGIAAQDIAITRGIIDAAAFEK
jgi:ornithine cyclodeaminase